MSTEKPHGSDDRRWWLSKQGKPTGPFDAAYILNGLRTGMIPPDTFACLVGGQTWKKLSESTMFASACQTAVSAQPSAPPPPLPQTAGPAAWNPRTLGWLGLLFSPLWLGIMAAVNGKRLASVLPVWRPVVLGVGATVLDVVISIVVGDFYLLDLALYLGAIAAIWTLDLQPQVPAFDQQAAATGRQASWLVPSLAGAPCALVVFLVFIVVPLMPMEPLEVCQRFVNAKSLGETKKYTSTKLWPALEALDAQPDESGWQGRAEWVGEEAAPPELGGHLVGFRMYFRPKAGSSHLLEGLFHLKEIEGAWKIEEWYLTSYDGQESPEPIPISVAYPYLINAGGKPQSWASTGAGGTNAPSSMTKKATGPKKYNPFEKSRGPHRVLTVAYDKFGWFGVIVVLAAVCGAFVAYDAMKTPRRVRFPATSAQGKQTP